MATKTLKHVCEQFVEHLKATGTAEITASNYWRILMLFVTYLGEDKDIRDITVRNVGDFYRSKPATMKTLKDGTVLPRADLSYLQIKRNVRLMLCWAHDVRLIESVPLPPDERRFLEEKPEKSEDDPKIKTKPKPKAAKPRPARPRPKGP